MQRQGWRFPPERREVLVSEERRQALPPEQILAMADIQTGETVLDLGAGNGFWIEALSRLVGPDGTVIAADVEPVMLDDLRAVVRDRNLTNVEVVQSEETSVPLESGTVDVVLLAYVLHEPADPMEFLREVVRLLKPAGRVFVVEWHDRPTESGPPLEVRISAQEARALLGDAGLSVDTVDTSRDEIYLLLAREFQAGDPEATHPTV